MDKIIISYAINILLKEVALYSGNLEALKPSVDASIHAHVPAMVDPMLEQVANAAIDDMVMLLKDTADLNAVLTDVAAGNWNDAMAKLWALAQRIFLVPTPSQVKLMAVLGDAA